MKNLFTFCVLMAAAVGSAEEPLTAQRALELAAGNRKTLQVARLKVEQAQKAARALCAYPATSIGVGASSRSEVGANDQDLVLTQPIDVFGRRSAGRNIGEAGVKLALAEYVAAATELQADVLTALVEASSANHQKEVAQELLTIAESLLKTTKRRFDEGKVAEIQLTRANIEFERARQLAHLRTNMALAAQKRLNGVLGNPRNELVAPSELSLSVPESSAKEARAEQLRIAAEVQLAEAEERVASLSNRPQVSLQLVRSPWSNNPGYFVGRAQVTWELFDHGRARNEGGSARKKAEAARKQLQDTNDRVQTEIEAAQIEVAARQERIKSYEAILVSARDLVEKSQRGYTEGFGSQIDILEASRALREVEQEMVEARQQLSLAIIGQYKAAGFLSEVLK